MPEGFKMGETRWNFEVRPGEKVSLNGAIESVYAQLLELNRNYETDNAEQISARLTKFDREIAAIKEKRLQRRHGWSPVPLTGGRRDLDRGLRLLTRQLLVELGHWMVQLRNFDEFNRLSKVWGLANNFWRPKCN